MAVSTYAEVSLGDVADFRNGKSLPPERYSLEGQNPVFGSNGQIARTNEVLYKTPVIAIGRVGAYCGSVHYVPGASWVTDNAIAAVPKAGIDLRFLYYLLGSLQLGRTAIGSAQPLMTQGGLRAVRAVAPPLPEQRAIAAVLGTLDDKIELNRRMNATLGAMARALFQSWFVDFDPVRAKAEGRPPVGLDAPTAALFPTQFQPSDFGEIPQGWSYHEAQDVAQIGIGKTPPRKEPEWFSEAPTDVPWVSIRDMGSSGVFMQQTSEFLTEEAVSRFNVRRIPKDTVLLSFKLTIGRVVLSDMPLTTNEAIAHFNLLPKFGLSREFLYLYLAQFKYDSLGSTSSIATAVNSVTIRKMPILVPPKDLIEAFSELVSLLFERIRTNQSESRALSGIRDALLPKLLSGEVEVPRTA